MQEIDSTQLVAVVGGESLGQVLTSLAKQPSVPVGHQYQSITSFIADHSFFHQGLMDKSIGFGKHGRNVPIIGPAMMIGGAAATVGTLGLFGPTTVAKGWETTRATIDAP
jgi:hypothetical protein